MNEKFLSYLKTHLGPSGDPKGLALLFWGENMKVLIAASRPSQKRSQVLDLLNAIGRVI